MRTIIKLFRLQMDDRSDLFKTGNLKKMSVGILKYAFFLLIATLVLVVAVMGVTVFGFSINADLLSLVFAVTQVISFFFALGTIIRDMYSSKDNELLMVLPATPDELFISKLAVIYAQEFLMNTMMIFPLTFSLGFVASAGASYFLAIPFLLILLPVLPLAVASIVSVPVMAIVRLLKKNALISVIAILVIAGFGVWGYCGVIDEVMSRFDLTGNQVETVSVINAFIARVGGKFPLFGSLGRMCFSFSEWYWLPLFVVICAVALFLGAMVIKPFFFRTAMTELEAKVELKTKKHGYIVESPLKSMLRKEITEIFRSPDYFFEYYLFTFLMPLFVFCYDRLMISIAVSQAGETMVAGSHILVVAIFAMLSNVSSANAITKEGGNYYISKIIPVDYYKQILAKYLFNLILTGVALFVTAIMSCFILPVWQVIMGTLAVFLASAGHIALGIDMDIKSPTLDWYSNEEIAARNKNIGKSIMWGMVVAVLMGVVIMFTAKSKLPLLPWIGLVVFGLVFCVHRILFLILRINCAYNEIEI